MAGEPTFNPSQNPSYPVRRQRQPRINAVEYGDGYIERSADGINSNPLNATFQWKNLTKAEADDILDFLEARRGHGAFLYTVPGELSARKFVCLSWDDTLTDVGNYDIDASFTQVFDR